MENKKVSKKQHTKGFMFDSLVYRFKDYQARAFDIEVKEHMELRHISYIDARNIIRNRHNRDLIRFIEILNEAMGEHD